MLQTSSNLETAVSLLAASVFTMFYAHDSYVHCTETLTHLLKLVCQLIPGVFQLKLSNPEASINKKSSQTQMGSSHTYLPLDGHSCREMVSMRNKVLNELDTPQITYRSNFAGFQQSCTRNG